jgi:acetylglutamate kinase
MFLNRTIRLFLDSIGRREEYEFYLRKFQALDTPAFGLLCPNLAAVEQGAAVLEFDMQFLLRLELHPALLLAGPDAQAMHRALAAEADIWAPTPLDQHPPATWADHSAEAATQAARAGKVPLLLSARTAPEVLPRLLPTISRRVHFVRARGPLRDVHDQPLPFYYTARDNESPLAEEDQTAFAEGCELLAAFPGLHFSFTSPFSLLEEFFTVRGSGTMLRKGSVIRPVAPEAIDRARLEQLLVESFGRPLGSTAWFDAVAHAYVEEDYRGAALLEQRPEGAYLSKFAVGTEARGEGLAQELWTEIAAHHGALFWRSRTANPVNQWYDKKATGRFTNDDWRVYWKGIRAEDVPSVVRYCSQRPSDFA